MNVCLHTTHDNFSTVSHMSAKQSLGQQIEAAMKRLGWKATGATLARRYQERFEAGVTEQSASAWLRGRRIPSAEHLQGLGELLGVQLRIASSPDKARASRPKPEADAPATTQEDRDAWQAFLVLTHEDRKLARELIHALARNRRG